MSLEEHADYERRVNGARLVSRGGVWWRQTRLLFFRPLFLFQELGRDVEIPAAAYLGAAQFPVRADDATGKLQLLICDGLSGYSMESQPAGMRRKIRKAREHVKVEVLANRDDFCRLAHPVYLEFHLRTQYRFNEHRRSGKGFRAWADALFNTEKVRVMGAFVSGNLVSVLISFRVGDVLFYSSHFGNQQALEYGAADAVLHGVKLAAGADSMIKLIFAAVAGMPRGLDRFYLDRGFRSVDRPTALRGNRVLLAALHRLLPGLYRRVAGEPIRAIPSGSASDQGSVTEAT